MNKALLKSKISLFNHNFTDLALVVGCSRTRLSAKLNETEGAEFKKSEIEKIKREYRLSAEEVDDIFLLHRCLSKTQPTKGERGRRESMRKFLKEARKSKGLKQKDVADAVGISCAAYSNIEIGKRDPSVKLAKKIALFLGLDWTEFF